MQIIWACSLFLSSGAAWWAKRYWALRLTSTDRVHYLNPTASVVFSLCDGTRTTEEVAELVRSAWELETAPLSDVSDCIAQLRDEGVLR